MALRIDLIGDQPGKTKLVAQTWKGSATVSVLIQRNQDSYYLANNNQWLPEKIWHPLIAMSVNDGQLNGFLEPSIVDAILSQESQVRFLMQIRDDNDNDNDYIDSGVISIADSVLSSDALDKTMPKEASSIQPQVSELVEQQPQNELIDEAPVVEQPSPEFIEPIENNHQTKATKKPLIIIISIVMLLILLAILAYFLFKEPKNETVIVADNNVCNLNNVEDDELVFIRECLSTKPDTKAIIQLLQQAKESKKCNIAQRIYANQALKNTTIALRYAQEYNQNYYHENACFSADKETAIYWYETALNLDSNNKEAKKQLDKLTK